MTIEGSVQVAGFIAPTAPTDVYPTHDAVYGMDGWRSVADAVERNAISDERRRQGMMASQQDTGENWQLNAGPWIHTDADWTLLGSNPIGPAGGDLDGTYPNPDLATIGLATGPIGAAAVIPVVTIDAKGRVTALTSVTAVIPLLTGKVVWVDSVHGNDSTGVRERFDLPFLTIFAAVTAALSGDVVYVRPGSYSEANNIGKNGVSVYTPAGVTVNFSGFLINNPGTFSILGQGDFVGAVSSRFINLTAASNNISVQCRDLITTAGGGTSVFQLNSGSNTVKLRVRNISCDIASNAIFVFGNSWAIAANTLDVWADESISNTSGTALGVIQVRGSAPSYTLRCGRTMSSGGGSVIDTTTFSGGNSPLFLQADTFSAPGGLFATGAAGASASYTVSGRIISASSGSGVNWASAGSLNLQMFTSISGVTSGLNLTAGTVVIQGGPTNVSASGGPGIINSGTNLTGFFHNASGTTSGITLQGGTYNGFFQSISASNGPAVDVTSGATTNAIVASSISTSASNTPALRMTGGTNVLRITGARMTGNGNAPAVQRDIAGGALVIQHCVAIPGGSATNSFTASVATDVIAVTSCSARLAEDSNTTFRVNALNVSTFVQ